MPDGPGSLRARHPPVVTGVVVDSVVATGWRFRVFAHQLPLTVGYGSGFSGRALLAGRYHTIVSSQLLTRDGFMLTSIVLSLLLMLGGYELLAGSRRAALVATSSAVAGPVVVALVLAGGSALGNAFAGQTLSTVDYGASAITAGAGGALVSVLDHRWLRRAAVAFVLGGLVLHHQMADWEHLVAFPLGYALARVRSPRRARHLTADRRDAPSWRSAAWVAGTALGILAGTAVASSAVNVPVAPVVRAAPTRLGALPGAATRLSPSRLIDARYPTPSLGGARRVLIYLPAGYDSTEDRYPVIEILHGDPGNPEDLISALDLTAVMAASPPFIAVMPDGHGPVVSVGDYADTSRQRLGAAVSDDLRSWMDSTYRTTRDWGVTGLSSGGYGASYLASRPAGGYRRACPMSGYFVARDLVFHGEPRAVRDAASPILHVVAGGPPTLVIVGTTDRGGLVDARAYIAALQRVGQQGALAVLPGSHTLQVWRSALPRCVAFLLGTAPVASTPPSTSPHPTAPPSPTPTGSGPR